MADSFNLFNNDRDKNNDKDKNNDREKDKNNDKDKKNDKDKNNDREAPTQEMEDHDPEENPAQSINTQTEAIGTLDAPEPINELHPGDNICGDWVLDEKLGAGVFGSVYKCKRADKKLQDQAFYAMKVERRGGQVNLLALEVTVYIELAAHKRSLLGPNRQRHYLEMVDRGIYAENFYYLVMTMAGPSLDALRRIRPGKRFSMGTSLVLARQTLESLQQLHKVGFLHRDIKPANFAIGLGPETGIIYVFDFGMARRYVHRETGRLRPARPGKIGLRGTLKYASTRAHLERDLCRVDDLESWFYLSCEFIKGKLPWFEEEQPFNIFEMKYLAKKPETKLLAPQAAQPAITPADEPATPNRADAWRTEEGKARRLLFATTPRQFGEIMRIINELKFYDEPPYEQIYKLLADAVQATKATTKPLDWERGSGLASPSPSKEHAAGTSPSSSAATGLSKSAGAGPSTSASTGLSKSAGAGPSTSAAKPTGNPPKKGQTPPSDQKKSQTPPKDQKGQTPPRDQKKGQTPPKKSQEDQKKDKSAPKKK